MKLKLGCATYPITFMDEPGETGDGHDITGMINVYHETIQVYRSPSKLYQREVLMHEIVHAIMTNGGWQVQDEHLVDAIAHGMVEVMRRNPEIIAFITDKSLKEKV